MVQHVWLQLRLPLAGLRIFLSIGVFVKNTEDFYIQLFCVLIKILPPHPRRSSPVSEQVNKQLASRNIRSLHCVPLPAASRYRTGILPLSSLRETDVSTLPGSTMFNDLLELD